MRIVGGLIYILLYVYITFIADLKWLNSLTPRRWGSDFESVIFVYFCRLQSMSTLCEIALRWMALNIFDDDLSHWGQLTNICVGNITIISSDNGLSPGQHQAIFLTNDGVLLTGPLGTKFSEILIKIQTFSLKKNTFEKCHLRNGVHFISASMC